MIMNERHCKWLPTIIGATTGIVTVLFLSGYLWPIEKPQDGDTAVIGICIIIFIPFCIGALLRLLQKK